MSDTKPAPPSRAALVPLKQAKTIGEALQSAELLQRIQQSVPQHMNPNRMLRTFVQAVSQTPALARANMRSLLGAMLSCSQLGLEPNTPQGHAYLIPFDKRGYNKETRKWEVIGTDVQLILGYKGLLDLAFRSGQVASIHCDVVMPGDHREPGMWSYSYGSDGHLHHRPAGIDPAGTMPTHAYMHARLKLGEAYEVLPWSTVISIRNASQGYRAAAAARDRAAADGRAPPATYTEAPWVKHELAMGRKTAMRAGAKWMPSSIELAAAVSLDEAQDRRSLDFGMVYDGTANVLEGLPETNDEDPDADNGAFGVRGGEVSDAGTTQQSGTNDAAAAAEREKAAADAAAQRDREAAHAERERRFAEQSKPTPQQKPLQEPAQAATASAGAITPTADANPATGASAPEFSAFLAGADGEVMDDVGDGGHFVNPVLYARAYAAAWTKAVPDSRVALAEHNADGLEDAAKTPEAAAILDDMAHDSAAPAANEVMIGRTQVTVPSKEGGTPDLKGYLAALRDHAAVQSWVTIDSWAALQDSVVSTLPSVTKRAAQKIIADKRTALGTDKPPAAQQAADTLPQTDNEPPPPTEADAAGAANPAEPSWSKDAQWVVDELNRCKSFHDVEQLAGNHAVIAKLNSIKDANPAEHTALRDYAVGVRNRLSTPKES